MEVRDTALNADACDSIGPVLVQLPIRILVVCYEWPPVGGGGGRVAADIARGLARRGHEVLAVTSALKGLLADETVDRISIHRWYAGRHRADRCTVPEMGSYVLAHLLPLLFENIRFRPDVVHVQFCGAERRCGMVRDTIHAYSLCAHGASRRRSWRCT